MSTITMSRLGSAGKTRIRASRKNRSIEASGPARPISQVTKPVIARQQATARKRCVAGRPLLMGIAFQLGDLLIGVAEHPVRLNPDSVHGNRAVGLRRERLASAPVFAAAYLHGALAYADVIRSSGAGL